MASDPIKRRILAAREGQVVVAGRKFTLRRMADLPLARLREKHGDDGSGFIADLVRGTVVDWEMDEQTLYAGGSDAPVPFDTDLFMTWIEDRPEEWSELASAVLDQITSHRATRRDAEKN